MALNILFTWAGYLHLSKRSSFYLRSLNRYYLNWRYICTARCEDTLNLCCGIIMRRSGSKNRPALHLSSFVWRKDGSFVNATSATMTLCQVFLFCDVYFYAFIPSSFISADKILLWNCATPRRNHASDELSSNLNILHWCMTIILIRTKPVNNFLVLCTVHVI